MTDTANTNDSGSTNSDTSKTSSTSNTSTTPPAGYVPQDQVNSLIANERKTAAAKAKEDAIKEHFSDLGITDPAQIRSLAEKQLKADQESQTKAEQLEGKLTKEQETRSKAQQDAEKAKSTAQKLALKSEARLQALTLGVDPQYVDAFLDTAMNRGLGAVEVGGIDEDFAVDAEKVKSALDEVLKAVPIFKAAQPTPEEEETPPENVGGSGSNPESTTNVADLDWERMAREDPKRFEEYVKRSKMGERFAAR